MFVNDLFKITENSNEEYYAVLDSRGKPMIMRKPVGKTAEAYAEEKNYRIKGGPFDSYQAAESFWIRSVSPGKDKTVDEAGPFSYGVKKPRRGSVADLAAKKRQEQEKDKQPIEPKDHMVGVARVVKEMDKSAPQPGRDGRASHKTYGSRDTTGERGTQHTVKPQKAKHAVKDAEKILNKIKIKEGDEERKENRLWAMITDYEKRAKATKNDIKRDHLMKMAKQLRDKLKTSDVEEGLKFHGGFPDVDHMRGAVHRDADMITDNVKTNNKKDWDRAVDSINAKVFDDMAEFRTDSKGERVTGNSAVWAKWDNATQTGWFNTKGRPLKPWPVKEQGVAETSDYSRRRQREEEIISGQRPARKKAPAQTSDYARRREQEKKQGLAEGSVQDKLYKRHQELRKKRGAPDPEYYKEFGKSYDIEDDQKRYAHQAELKKKYGVTNEDRERYVEELGRAGYEIVTESATLCPECGGAAYADRMLAEKQDACYHKVKSRYKVWPSAYASGALVKCRKKGAANWGNKSKK